MSVLGGLLSGHIFATQTGKPFYLPWYKGELLDLARDLADRLMPAFSTPTGLPYARVYHYISVLILVPFNSMYIFKINLRRGLQKGETIETCRSQVIQDKAISEPIITGTAGAGSLILEFATLSRLTGDGRYEKAAYKVSLKRL